MGIPDSDHVHKVCMGILQYGGTAPPASGYFIANVFLLFETPTAWNAIRRTDWASSNLPHLMDDLECLAPPRQSQEEGIMHV